MFRWFKDKAKKKAENDLEKELQEKKELTEEVSDDLALDEKSVKDEVEQVVEEVVDVAQDLVDDTVETLADDNLEKSEEIVEKAEQVMELESEITEIEEIADTASSQEEVQIEESHEEEQQVPEEQEQEEQQEEQSEQQEKKGFFKGLFSGLSKTRKNIGDKIDNLINSYDEIDDELFEELEEILIMSDISYDSVMKIIDDLKVELVNRKEKNPAKIKEALRYVMAENIKSDDAKIDVSTPTVILVIGVNGAGKTTSIGKMASRFINDGKKVMIVAGDTFRAAAIDQLKVWAERSNAGFIAHEEGSDPSAVIFDGLRSAKARKVDVLICDTAGRLHNKVNLMNELRKMHGIIDREFPEARKEVLLVLDATTGQNAINQAKLFKEVADISGLIVTKLDGTAKGGFVFSIKNELGIPVKLIGVGEQINDLRDFDADDFVAAIVPDNKEDE